MISTLTNDESFLLGTLSNIPLNDECDFISSLSIAILSLKHRVNKNQKQKIILFVGSSVKSKKENNSQIGKKLKKYNITVNIISFGKIEKYKELLNILLNEVNNYNNSSLLEVPLGSYIMETLLNNSIMGVNNIDIDVERQGQNNKSEVNNQEPMDISQFERDINLALQMSLQESDKDENKKKLKLILIMEIILIYRLKK